MQMCMALHASSACKCHINVVQCLSIETVTVERILLTINRAQSGILKGANLECIRF